jgi:hypothetical protein
MLMLPQFALYGVGIALSARFGQAPPWRSEEEPGPVRPGAAGGGSSPAPGCGLHRATPR